MLRPTRRDEYYLRLTFFKKKIFFLNLDHLIGVSDKLFDLTIRPGMNDQPKGTALAGKTFDQLLHIIAEARRRVTQIEEP